MVFQPRDREGTPGGDQKDAVRHSLSSAYWKQISSETQLEYFTQSREMIYCKNQKRIQLLTNLHFKQMDVIVITDEIARKSIKQISH